MPTKIFISYSSNDIKIVEKVDHYLTSQGFDVWRDVNKIRTGGMWPYEIGEALEVCERLVLIVSKSAMKSHQVYKEWFYFDNHNKPLHCLLIETCELDWRLESYQYIDGREKLEFALSKLAEDLNQPFNPRTK